MANYNLGARRRWSKAEDATLTAGILNGLTTKEMSKTLGRTTHAIACRKNQIGMTDVRIQSPKGIVRRRKSDNQLELNFKKPVNKTPMAKKKTAKAPAMKPAAKTAKTPDMISAIAETVSRMTKQYGVKATVIVFEN